MIAASNFKGHLVKTSLWFASLFMAPVSMAQEAVVIQSGTPVMVGEGGVVLSPGLPPGAMVPGAMPPGQFPPPGTATPATGDAKPAGADAKGPAEPIKRKSEPPDPPNKREFDVKPDEQGMLQFQFRNQGWPELMRWLAEVSSMSLDWQELPGDYLNIATQRKHTLEEARDLFNRHLLARGFTMLEFDGTIQVLKTKGINAALVPKIDPEKLSSLPPNRFVRVSFSLNSLIAEEVAKELAPLVSNNGVLNALASTNRLEAMDAAGNLSELFRILNEEQSQAAQESLAREFELEHVRTVEVREQLMQFLGIESKKKGGAGGGSPEQQMMEMQQQQMMMQQQQQMMQQAGNAAPPSKKKSEIFIVSNIRRNSVIVHAPPDKMAIVASFISRVDVPNEKADSLQSLEARSKVYRLASLDPAQFIASLVSLDALEPTTQLIPDDKNNAIIAYASLSDHYTITKMLERLDGSARDVEVIQLRRLKAEDVAGTIKFLMGPEEKKEDKSSRRNFFYYDPFGRNDKKDSSKDAFRVAANAQDNQVLIWANEIERAEVMKLLIKLGELPPEGGNQSRIRVIDANRSPETREYLKRLQEAWNRISPTPLELPNDDQFEKQSKKVPGAENSSEEGSEQEEDREPAKKNPEEDKITLRRVPTRDENLERLSIPQGRFSKMSLVSSQADDDNDNKDGESETKATKQPTKAPIRISFDERGNLVLMGDDPEALSKLEQIMIDNAPPKRGYEVFIIKNSKPSWIKWSLEDYYKEDKKEPNERDGLYRWIFDMEQEEKKTDDPQLGKKRKMRFIPDNDTNTLVVVGADDAEIKTIEALIKLWDVPEKTNKQRLRYSKLMKIEFSDADAIVEAIKDAYRDLLSTNDKAFQKEAGDGKGSEGKESKRSESSDSVFDGAMNFSFSGRLSLGVDKVTKTIIVSAEGEDLLKLVCEMITELDEAAKPSGSVEILKLDGSNSKAMEKALTALSRANKGRKDKDPNAANQQPLNQQQMGIQQQQQFNQQLNNKPSNDSNNEN
jgi:type II secretory pathway component GspD/PulD (secretin)